MEKFIQYKKLQHQDDLMSYTNKQKEQKTEIKTGSTKTVLPVFKLLLVIRVLCKI